MREHSLSEESTLSDLRFKNEAYENLIKQYHEKIKVIKSFKGKKEFISQEILRIREHFLRPIEVKLGSGDFNIIAEMNFSEYRKRAYDMLSMGNDWKLSEIILGAEREYLQKKPGFLPFNKDGFEDALVSNMRDGVAYLQYEKFLNNKLKKPWYKKAGAIISVIVAFALTILSIINGWFDFRHHITTESNKNETHQTSNTNDATKK